MQSHLLNKDRLLSKLLERFDGKFSKLSDIDPPHLLKDSTKASRRIAEAVRLSQSITIVGDYDVDGVSATAIAVLFFRRIGHRVDAIIPNRFRDGYGISPSLLERIDTDLIVTVDNGIAAVDAALICKERGIDLIITDHHTPPKILPEAYAIVDPKQHDDNYPTSDICGAQVIWLLLALVKKELKSDVDMSEFLEILSLAIVADIMPLLGTNRAILKAGLEQMSRSDRPCFVIIREALNKSVLSSEDIAFNIAPRLNAAGRLEDASLALEFLLSSDEQSAYEKFEQITHLNNMRKEIESDTTSEAIEMIDSNDRVIVVAQEGWNEGVVGIVASRLAQKFERPAIVLSIKDGIAKGSARSVANIDLYSLMSTQHGLLDRFGGHKMAAGLSLSIDNLEQFRVAINMEALKLRADDFILKEQIFGELDAQSIDFELLDILDRFEPYGEANPRPVFLAKDAKVLSVSYMGEQKNHSRVDLELQEGKQNLNLIAFHHRVEKPKEGHFTCSYTINKNEFNNRVSIQLMLQKLYKQEA